MNQEQFQKSSKIFVWSKALFINVHFNVGLPVCLIISQSQNNAKKEVTTMLLYHATWNLYCKHFAFGLHFFIWMRISNNVSSVVEFHRWWVLINKIFGQESTYSKEFFFKSVNELRFVKKCQNCTFKVNFQCQKLT